MNIDNIRKSIRPSDYPVPKGYLLIKADSFMGKIAEFEKYHEQRNHIKKLNNVIKKLKEKE